MFRTNNLLAFYIKIVLAHLSAQAITSLNLLFLLSFWFQKTKKFSSKKFLFLKKLF